MWSYLFTVLFFSLNVEVDGRNIVSKDIINDLNFLRDEVKELVNDIQETLSRNDTQGKGEVDKKDLFQKIEEVKEKVEKEHPEEMVSSDGKPVKVFEGDIMENEEVKRIIESAKGTVQDVLSDTTTNKDHMWPNAIVYYEFAPGESSTLRNAFKAAVDDFQAHTCIKWVPKLSNTRDYVKIIHGGSCWSYVGKQGGMQELSLGPGCQFKGTAIHEMMHALGFWHEQSRYDRDLYVKIYLENMEPEMEHNFEKYGHGKMDTLHEPYDFRSIMHYGNYAFSKNGEKTIVARHNGYYPLGSLTEDFTETDIKQLRKLYKCSEGVVNPCAYDNGGCSHTCENKDGVAVCSCPEDFRLKVDKKTCTESCQDVNVDCSLWASRGRCGKSPTYMARFCCASCKTKGSCQDVKIDCFLWASRGRCEKSPTYMARVCCASCKTKV